MTRWFKQLRRLLIEVRERESAQRRFLRAVYESPSRFPAGYEYPAYLRKARRVMLDPALPVARPHA